MKARVFFLAAVTVFSVRALAQEEVLPPLAEPIPQDGKRRQDFAVRSFFKTKPSFRVLAKNSIRHGHVQEPGVRWEWGFRTGIGWNTVSKNWNITAVYTRFHSKSFAGMEASDGFVMPVWKGPDPKKSGLMRQKDWIGWRLHMDLADLELGKNIEWQSGFVLRPHVGMRGAFFYQKRRKIKSRFKELPEGGSDRILFCANNCAGLGGRTGVDSFWRVTPGLHFFADGALSLLAGYYNLDQKQRPIRKDELLTKEENTISNGIVTGEFSVGMQYEKPIWQDTLVTFRVGYELNYIFNQTRWMDWFSNAKGALSDAGSGLSLQGFTLSLRWDY